MRIARGKYLYTAAVANELTMLAQTPYLLKRVNDKLSIYLFICLLNIFLNMNKGSPVTYAIFVAKIKTELSNYNQNFENISI